MGRRVRCTAAATAVLLAATALSGCSGGPTETLPLCTAGDVVLTTEQTANAATIAAVGLRVGLPHHAVTVALATAFQESGLRNLNYGDRDSLGLFQQRPSQGWGTAERVRTPRLAAESFYARLRRVPKWQTLPVTAAAQAVQRSAAPEAYADWEDASRQLARALTGEVVAGLACEFDPGPKPGLAAQLRQQAVAELGPGGLENVRGAGPAWAAASWLVAQAQAYGVSSVSLSGKTWTAERGTWKSDRAATTLRWTFTSSETPS